MENNQVSKTAEEITDAVNKAAQNSSNDKDESKSGYPSETKEDFEQLKFKHFNYPTPFTNDEEAYFKKIAEGHCPEFIQGTVRLDWIEGALNMAYHLTKQNTQQPSPSVEIGYSLETLKQACEDAMYAADKDGMLLFDNWWKRNKENYEPTITPSVEQMAEAFPLHDVLKILSHGTKILLHKKSYDGPDYEEMEICCKRADEIISALSSRPIDKVEGVEDVTDITDPTQICPELDYKISRFSKDLIDTVMESYAMGDAYVKRDDKVFKLVFSFIKTLTHRSPPPDKVEDAVGWEELWDKYSEYMDDDLDSLQRFAGTTIMTKLQFEKLYTQSLTNNSKL